MIFYNIINLKIYIIENVLCMGSLPSMRLANLVSEYNVRRLWAEQRELKVRHTSGQSVCQKL